MIIRFKYRSRNYTVSVDATGQIWLVKSATRKFYESQPSKIEEFVSEVQSRARAALAKPAP